MKNNASTNQIQPSQEQLDKFIADSRKISLEAAQSLPAWERVGFLREWQGTAEAKYLLQEKLDQQAEVEQSVQKKWQA